MSTDIRSRISTIQVPVLVMAAYCKMPEYPGYTRESVINTYTSQYKACSSCIVHAPEDRARHFIMYDTPEWYFTEIDNFIKH